MWPPGAAEGQTEFWPETEYWPENVDWDESPAWTPAVTSPATSGPVYTEALSSGFRDP